jgi:hypothetical protein
MKLGPEYCKQLRDAFRRHANFPPNRCVALGDYGVIQENVFERLGNISDLGLSILPAVGTGQSNFIFKSQGSVDFELIAKGEVQPGGIVAVRAGLNLKFNRENSVFFCAAGCTIQAAANIRDLEPALIQLLQEGRWESDFYLVTELTLASKTTAIVSSSGDSEVKLEAMNPALEVIQLADASLQLQVRRSRNTSFEMVTEGAQVPLMQLSRLRGLFHDELRPSLGAIALGAQEPFRLVADGDVTPITLQESVARAAVSEPVIEAVLAEAFATAPLPAMEAEGARFLAALATPQPGFELQRVLDIHLPLLAASYQLAHGEPNPPLPGGVEILSKIEGAEEHAAIALAVPRSPEAQRSIENDLRALDIEAERGAVAAARVPNPNAFGFVARETGSASHIVCVRGTLTPEEWVKDFTAIANPFNEVPNFGFVHLGFEIMWRRIRLSVLDALAGIPNGSRITFVGHSLGAAMILLGAVEVAVNVAPGRGWLIDAFTVGSPRPGGVRFRVNFNRTISRYFRVTNQGDVVPQVPPLILPPIFNHPGVEIGVVGRNGNPHSLDAYRDGLNKLASRPRGALAAEPVMGARTL